MLLYGAVPILKFYHDNPLVADDITPWDRASDRLPAESDDCGRRPDGLVERDLRERAQRTVLVVDDEPAVCSLVSRLVSEAGYNVLTATNGPQAISTARTSGAVHVLLTDLRMPDMNGVELAGHIRAIHPRARVLIMAAYPSADPLQWPVVIKPFSLDHLERELQRLLEGHTPI